MNINSVINKSVDLKNVEKIIYRTFFIIIFSLPLIPEITHFGIYSLKYMLFNFFTIATLLVFLFISFLKIYDRNNQKSILDSLKKSDIKLNLLDIFIFTYFILVIFSSVLTKFGFINTFLGNNGRGEGVLTIFCYIATFYLFKNGVKYIGNMWKFAIFNVIIVSLYSIIQANFPQGFGEPFSPVHLTNVATGTMKNQNFLSSYVCIFLPTFMYIFIVSKKKLILIPTAMLFSTLIFSKTLGGYLTVICMFFIIVLSTLIFYKPR